MNLRSSIRFSQHFPRSTFFKSSIFSPRARPNPSVCGVQRLINEHQRGKSILAIRRGWRIRWFFSNTAPRYFTTWQTYNSSWPPKRHARLSVTRPIVNFYFTRNESLCRFVKQRASRIVFFSKFFVPRLNFRTTRYSEIYQALDLTVQYYIIAVSNRAKYTRIYAVTERRKEREEKYDGRLATRWEVDKKTITGALETKGIQWYSELVCSTRLQCTSRSAKGTLCSLSECT